MAVSYKRLFCITSDELTESIYVVANDATEAVRLIDECDSVDELEVKKISDHCVYEI